MSNNEKSERRSSVSLLGLELAGAAAAERVVELPVEQIRPNPEQPRRDFPAESLRELSDSIKDHGLQQPIIVREVRDAQGAVIAHELIAGERRLRAHQIAGLKVVKAIVRRVDDVELLRLALVENLHREDLSALDRAMSFCRFRDMFHKGNVEQAAVALKVARSVGFSLAKIGEAPEAVRQVIKRDDLDARASELLASTYGKLAKRDSDEAAQRFLGRASAAPVTYARLEEIRDEYFPPKASEKPAPAKGKAARPEAGTFQTGGGFWKNGKGTLFLKLELPAGGDDKDDDADRAARQLAAGEAERFFKEAGFRSVEIRL